MLFFDCRSTLPNLSFFGCRSQTLDYTAPRALDRFGRIVDHVWKNSDDVDIVRIQHGYDVTGNRLNRQDAVNPSWSETYGYDEMDQIATMSRSGHSESWQYDPTGNWMQYSRNNVVETRSHNAANEILTSVVHDRNGNMTVMPKPTGTGNLTCKYDAWNRLVEVGSNIRYDYDGRNHRIKKTVDNVVTKSFFNHGWQELESRTGVVITNYVWGLRYIDDLVLRVKGDERLYSLADPNWNIVAITDEEGAVQERFHYDAFGKVNGLNSDWNRTFTGQVLDAETGLMLYRMRFYHIELGRFVTRDPIGYRGKSLNIYSCTWNRINRYVDSFGLVMWPPEEPERTGLPELDTCLKGCWEAYDEAIRGPESYTPGWREAAAAAYNRCVKGCWNEQYKRTDKFLCEYFGIGCPDPPSSPKPLPPVPPAPPQPPQGPSPGTDPVDTQTSTGFDCPKGCDEVDNHDKTGKTCKPKKNFIDYYPNLGSKVKNSEKCRICNEGQVLKRCEDCCIVVHSSPTQQSTALQQGCITGCNINDAVSC